MLQQIAACEWWLKVCAGFHRRVGGKDVVDGGTWLAGKDLEASWFPWET